MVIGLGDLWIETARVLSVSGIICMIEEVHTAEVVGGSQPEQA
jgi:hypothetical protein